MRQRRIRRCGRWALLVAVVVSALYAATPAAVQCEIVKLEASDRFSHDYFGNAVAIDGDTVVVGKSFALTDCHECGAVYVYERNHGGPGRWGEVVKLIDKSRDEQTDDEAWLGYAVAIDGDLIAATEPRYYDAGGRVRALCTLDPNSEGIRPNGISTQKRPRKRLGLARSSQQILLTDDVNPRLQYRI